MSTKKPSRTTRSPRSTKQALAAPNVINMRDHLIAKGRGGSALCQRLDRMAAEAIRCEIEQRQRDDDGVLRRLVDGRLSV